MRSGNGRSIHRRTRVEIGAMMAAATAMLLSSGCTTVEESVRTLEQHADKVFASEPAAPADDAADRTAEAAAEYRRALAARDAGRDADAPGGVERAAKLGHPEAAYELGMALQEGRGVPADPKQAAEWVNIAAERGDPRAQYLVGASYFAGAGVERDAAYGLGFLEAAGEQGHDRAEYLAGRAYANGDGAERDPAWAARWYAMAARRGHTKAQLLYGIALAKGIGVPRDEAAALQWLTLAARDGDADALAAKLRDSVAARVPADVRDRAASAARDFHPLKDEPYADPPTVAYVQQRLAALGYRPGPVDGAFGPRTRAAVRAFMADRGEPSGGAVTPSVVDALRAAKG